MKNNSHSSIELLEPRISPATLSASLVGTTLKVSALAPTTAVQAFILQTGPNSFSVSDSGGLAVPFTAVTAIQVSLSNVTDDLDIAFVGAKFKGTTKVDAGLGSDSITFTGPGTSAGNVSVVSDANATVIVDTATRITGPLSFHSEGGLLGISGQAGVVKAIGISNIIGLNNSVIQSVNVAAAATGLSANLAGTIFGPLVINGDIGNESITLSGRIDGKVTLSLKDGGNNVNSTALIGNTFTYRGGIHNDTVNLQPGTGSLFPAVTGISGNVSISLGAGTNNVALMGSGVFAGTVRIMGGANSDTLGTSGSLFFGGAFTANLGAGANISTISASNFMGNFTYAGLADADSVTLGSNTIVRGKLSLSLGDGTNYGSIAPGLIGGAVRVTGGVGNDAVIFGGMTLDGPVTLNMKDGVNDVDFIFSTIRNGVTYTGGNLGTDDLRFDDCSLSGALLVRAGGGTNIFLCDVSGSLAKITYSGGDSFDYVGLLNPATPDTYGPFLVANVMLGEGNDTMYVDTTTYLDLNLDGGVGADTLTRSAAALAAGFDHKNFETFTIL